LLLKRFVLGSSWLSRSLEFGCFEESVRFIMLRDMDLAWERKRDRIQALELTSTRKRHSMDIDRMHGTATDTEIPLG
jgi:hypothetical protein